MFFIWSPSVSLTMCLVWCWEKLWVPAQFHFQSSIQILSMEASWLWDQYEWQHIFFNRNLRSAYSFSELSTALHGLQQWMEFVQLSQQWLRCHHMMRFIYTTSCYYVSTLRSRQGKTWASSICWRLWHAFESFRGLLSWDYFVTYNMTDNPESEAKSVFFWVFMWCNNTVQTVQACVQTLY